MEKFKIKGEYIQLNQLIKAMAWSSNGAEANSFIDLGKVKVNGEIEYRKRNKLVPGDSVEYNLQKVEIE
ncbi:MAG: RNA-binding S4 domain-containing protein [Bacteroidetes bacterium]|nr:RNA-binding S4 domain-containing protein [Bacteroidota bacterium]